MICVDGDSCYTLPFSSQVTDLKGLPEEIRENLVVLECIPSREFHQSTDNLQNENYDTVIDIIRNAGRPVTLIFGELKEGEGPRMIAQSTAPTFAVQTATSPDTPPNFEGLVDGPPPRQQPLSNAAIETWTGARSSVLDQAMQALDDTAHPPPLYSAHSFCQAPASAAKVPTPVPEESEAVPKPTTQSGILRKSVRTQA